MKMGEAKKWLGSVQAALNTPWILDIDTPIKPLYGKQDGAQISDNPRQPGRPSHAYPPTGSATCAGCSMSWSLPGGNTVRPKP
ncbi:MAG: hypothetical protein WBI41_11185, partial [Azovibrio sp.]|uniref:hypothetical protein n=1 Tax=Azovibrio sp. TaxID=1872673 RepID=UPI003C728B9E